MSAYQKLGTLAWIADKLSQVVEAAEIMQNASDPATRDQAAFDAATKLAEAVGIGIPLWFLDKAITKTGLDRVFDTLKKDKKFEEYLKDQIADRNIRDYGIGTIAEWGLDRFREWVSVNQILDPIFDAVTDRYAAARAWVFKDPLAIDLDGDGIETVGIAGGVLFDHDGDGIKTGTGWVKSDDALVVWDRNGNGLIDTGAELFGIDYVKSNGQKALNGFDALADLDGNGDQLFNSSDAQYANVKIWRDLNQDGISQSDELQSLSAAGIASINLAAQSTNQNLGNGNTQTATATYTRADGTTGTVANLTLADNPFHRAYPDHLDTTAVASLPDMQGAGRLRDLQEAATLSAALAAQLADLQANYRTHEQFDAEIETLIQNWANTSDWSTTPVGYQIPAYFEGGNPGAPLAETSPGYHLVTVPDPLNGGTKQELWAFIYQPDGVTREQLNGAYRVPLNGNAPPLPEKYLRAVYLIETLERFNGLPFVTFDGFGGVVTGSGRAIPPEQAGGGSVRRATHETRRWQGGDYAGRKAIKRQWRRRA